ncbi:MAG: aldo/keto reductase [Bacillus sp. (in: Bacteria)]|nr:aldo/keto reductase [Bacillus sp. (in: firmicutes)]
MRKNKLGHSDLYLSEIGFGCMSLGIDQKENERMIHEAIDRGVNFFDTADLYDKGWNESSLGKALLGKRDKVIIATKGGNQWEDDGTSWKWNPSKNYLKGAVKKSLLRLNTDYLDLYQLHGGTIDDPMDETIEAFEEMVKEGVIRYYGISSIRPNVIKAYLENSNITSIMMQYSLLDRRPEEWFDIISDHNASVIARGPLAKGLLTDNHEQKSSEKGYLDYTQSELQQLIHEFIALSNEQNLSKQQLALGFVSADPVVATTIPGASRLEQLMENLATANHLPLSDELIARLKEITKLARYKQHR